MVSLLLSLSSIQRFEDQVFDLLKSLIVQSFRDSEHIENVPWIAALTPSDLVGRSDSLFKTFTLVCSRATFGWETITQALVTFAAVMIDANTPKFYDKGVATFCALQTVNFGWVGH